MHICRNASTRAPRVSRSMPHGNACVSAICVVLLAALLQIASGDNSQCAATLSKKPCGAQVISEKGCHQLGCCFGAAPSRTAVPACFQPNFNAEKSAVLATAWQQNAGARQDVSLMGLPHSLADCSPWHFIPADESPRTYDTWGMGWMKFHNILSQQVANADKAARGFDIVFYGDSITEFWHGTSGGLPYKIGDTIDPDNARKNATFEKFWGSKYRAEVLGIAGDEVGHLWWRINNGEAPAVHLPRVAVVLIGTNDLGGVTFTCEYSEESQIIAIANVTVPRVHGMLQDLRARLPSTHIVLQAVLPRGENLDPEGRYIWPSRFTRAITITNAGYEALASADPMIHFVNCGGNYINSTGIRPELMPDGLHPSSTGLALMSKCLEPLVERLLRD